jgi:hypothetical protein
MDPTLESCDGKLRWAKRHLQTLKDELAAPDHGDAHEITVEDDPEASEYTFKVVGLKDSKPCWSYLAGDCIHNLRSALDHLTYQLAILNLGRDLTDDEAGSTGFPIFSDPTSFPQPGKGKLKLLRRGEQTRITELQPFNAWDASIWGPSEWVVMGGGRHRMSGARIPTLLERLAELDNIDKHRLAHATYRGPEWFNAPEPPAPFTRATMSGDRLEAEVGRWKYPTPRPDLPADMDMKRYFPIGVALGDAPFMQTAVELLTSLAHTVEIVIELFRPCIEDGSSPLPVPPDRG